MCSRFDTSATVYVLSAPGQGCLGSSLKPSSFDQRSLLFPAALEAHRFLGEGRMPPALVQPQSDVCLRSRWSTHSVRHEGATTGPYNEAWLGEQRCWRQRRIRQPVEHRPHGIRRQVGVGLRNCRQRHA